MRTLLAPRPPPSAGVAALLTECHGRIRQFSALALRIAAEPAPDLSTSTEAVADAAARVHRYFTLALPLHERDEEDSLIPRLRGRDAPLDAALDRMLRDHRGHAAALASLLDLAATLAADPARLPALRAPLHACASALTAYWDEHLALEEATVFPAIDALLDDDARADILRELRERRAPR